MKFPVLFLGLCVGLLLMHANPASAQFSIKLSDVLKQAKLGDHLIIEPVRLSDRPAKRIIRVVAGGDGC